MSFTDIIIFFLTCLRIIAVYPLQVSKGSRHADTSLGSVFSALNFRALWVVVLAFVHSTLPSLARSSPRSLLSQLRMLPTRIRVSLSQALVNFLPSHLDRIKAYVSAVVDDFLKSILLRSHPGLLSCLQQILEDNLDRSPDTRVRYILRLLEEIGHGRSQGRTSFGSTSRESIFEAPDEDAPTSPSEVVAKDQPEEEISDFMVLNLVLPLEATSERKGVKPNGLGIFGLFPPLESSPKYSPIPDTPRTPIRRQLNTPPLTLLPTASTIGTIVVLPRSASSDPFSDSFAFPLTQITPPTSENSCKDLTLLGGKSESRQPPANPLASFDCNEGFLSGLTLDNYRPIGEGSYGAVYKATNSGGKKVAVKIIKRLPSYENSITGEINAMIAAEKSRWAPVLECWKYAQEEVLIAMSYYDEGTLADLWLNNGGIVNPQLAIFYTAELILALHDLHSRGIVHCDIKFQNVMLHNGHIKIVDFGVAKTFNHNSVSPSDYPTFTTLHDQGGDAFPLLFPGPCNPFSIIEQCGTPGFSAPEVWREQKYSFGVDYFSVGCILHAFLAGKLPFVYDQEKSDYNCNNVLVDPEGVLDEVQRNFLDRVLDECPYGRLDVRGMKEHPIFQNIDWEALAEGRVKPPGY